MALGAALALLVVASPASAGNGGAAPTAAPGAGSGGAATTVATAAGNGGRSGGAPADRPAPSGGRASSRRTGGAAVGVAPRRAKPPRRAAPKRRAAARRPARKTPPRRVAAPSTPDPGTVAGRFPVVGSYTFGGEGSRFGAGRPGHVHQGQDVAAASGTPIVAPVDGTVTWKANQPKGAGIYIVVRGAADGRDYVFMHLKRGSVVVAPGQAVAAGDALAQVGSTGASSGPHLHFEIWVGGWQASGGAPIDPLPQLQRWAAGTA
ncbi:peptidoglycan DD-metalloendopeptidase family protein [Conexibacter arvalis]|uniref:Murein DD-endopeptidase MepM/ murein hydrolase activator NlpD n=1 Tax=Conexibacter arvalis TaxID=912552 RepID=A0A840IA06_9ACTN|nr:murein DD-endopeptidase MepM/ murein hydrolase activator NlpD [Conexibacter arvalis]